MKNGILVVNKPEGISSAGVVSRLKRLLKVKKIGHTGTLDPFATGVLPVALGRATRISKYFLKGVKGYLGEVTLGRETDTLDCTGTVTRAADSETLSKIEPLKVSAVVQGFLKVREQVPPAYSALKHEGQPLYKLARKGQIIEKPARPIEIMHISMENFRHGTDDLPVFNLPVVCSGGTYIRCIARDIGGNLGCGAHLSGLIRTRSGQFKIEDAAGLDALEKMSLSEIDAQIIPMAQCLEFLPSLTVDNRLALKIKYGQPLLISEVGQPQISCVQKKSDYAGNFEPDIRVLDHEGDLLAIVTPDKAGQTYKYCCVFNA